MLRRDVFIGDSSSDLNLGTIELHVNPHLNAILFETGHNACYLMDDWHWFAQGFLENTWEKNHCYYGESASWSFLQYFTLRNLSDKCNASWNN